MPTPCCFTPQDCDTHINYSPIVIDERRLPFVVELDLSLSVLNPMPGENQKFCYHLTGIGEDTSEFIDLSHWVLTLCPEITKEEIVNITVTIGGVSKTIGNNVELFVPPKVDPPTGCPGLKFNFSLSKVLDGNNSSGFFCFELTKSYPVGEVNVCLFGGARTASGLSICGPVCSTPPPDFECETTVSQFADICVPITIKPFAYVGESTTTCCGDPTIDYGECPGEICGSCTFTVSQTICVELPVSFGATAESGEPSVDCGAAETGSCSTPE